MIRRLPRLLLSTIAPAATAEDARRALRLATITTLACLVFPAAAAVSMAFWMATVSRVVPLPTAP